MVTVNSALLGPGFDVIFALAIIAMTAQSAFNIRLRLFIWEDAANASLNRAPSTYRSPHLSFTILLPARHEERVFAQTLQKVNDLNYPRGLVQVIAICREDDLGTIAEATAKINELRNPNLELLIFNDAPINKPHGLNLALKIARGDVVTIFDAEDEPHPDILNIANTVMRDARIDVIQSGVQLMNHDTRWFCVLNVLEYFFWFKSSLHYFARLGMIPLGGNTVFVRRPLLDQLGGWDENCLTEDADLGIRLSVGRANIRVIYDDTFVTREETPHSVAELLRQRTRWNQGFLQILFKGDWLRLERPAQRLMAFYVLVMPEVQALLVLIIPISVAFALLVRLPLWLAMFSFLPLFCLGLTIAIDLVGLAAFMDAHGERWSWREGLRLVLAFIPYQWILGVAALRATYRHARGTSNWEKTEHLGNHRAPSGLSERLPKGIGEPV